MKRVHSLLLLAVLGSALAACSDAPSAGPIAKSDYAAIARGKIVVEGGLVEIAAPAQAMISDVNVVVGSKVEKGALLAKVDNKQATLNLSLAKAEAAQAQAQLTALQSRLPAAEQLAKRVREAADAGAVELQQALDAEGAVVQLKSELGIARSALEVVAVHQQQQQQALEQLAIKAPVAGEVLKVQLQAGTLAGGTAFVLLPDRPLQVRAEVNESFLAALHEGSKADVTLAATPNLPAMQATLVRIGKLLESPQDAGEQVSGRVVEAILAFDQPQPVLVGQNVMVKFHE